MEQQSLILSFLKANLVVVLPALAQTSTAGAFPGPAVQHLIPVASFQPAPAFPRGQELGTKALGTAGGTRGNKVPLEFLILAGSFQAA